MNSAKCAKRFVLIILVIAALWPTAKTSAIEVRIVGQEETQTIKHISYDYDVETKTGKFTLYNPAALTMKAEMIKHIDADEAFASELRETNAVLDKTNAGLRSEIGKLKLDATSLGEIIEQNKLTIKNFKVKAKQDLEDAEAVNVPELQYQVENLEKQVKKLTAENRMLLQKSKMNTGKTSPPKDAVTLTQEPTHKRSKIQGLVDVFGRVHNAGPEPLDTVIIEVSALDKDGKLLNTTLTFVTQIMSGQTRSFQTDIEADFDKIAKVEVVVVDTF